jgi:LETM1 and EF-hand domain-containing protein 1
MKQALKVKLEMAKFLQQTLDDMAVQGKGRSSEAAKEFAEFFVKVKCRFSFPRFSALLPCGAGIDQHWI